MELTAHVDGAEISSQLGPPHVPTPWKQAGSRLAEAYGAMSPRGYVMRADRAVLHFAGE